MGVSLKDKLLKIDHESLVAEIINLCDQDINFQKLIVQTVVFCSSDGKQLTKLIQSKITSIKRSTKFLDYYAVHSLTKNLNSILNMIANKLLEQNPVAAIKCLYNLLETSDNSIERVDDSNGEISGCYSEALELLGIAYSKTEAVNVEKLVEFLFTTIKNNDYGIFKNCVKPFYETLGEKGLTLLESKLKQNLVNYKKEDYFKIDFIIALLDIADCKKNVEEYINVLLKFSTFDDHDYLNIASRYASAWQEEKALEWLEKITNKNDNNYINLKSELLTVSGKDLEAANLLTERFHQTLALDYYSKLISREKDPSELKIKLLNIILAHKDRLLAVNLLCDIHEYELANQIILAEFECFADEYYYNVKEIAKKLSKTSFSLASILMYRIVIANVISRASSKYYNWALSYINKIIDLGLTVKDWENKDDNLTFIKGLKEAHPRKTSFWSGYVNLINEKQYKKPDIDFTKFLII
jgi:hypothetical protein